MSQKIIRILGVELIFIILALSLVWCSQKASFNPLKSAYEDSLKKSQFVTLNYYIPDLSSLTAFINSNAPLTHEHITHYQSYYQKVAEITHSAEAYSMLGFCSFYEGDFESSAQFFQRSLTLNPTFFWNYYNLGLILLKSGQNEKALVILSEGLKLNPLETLKTMVSSPIFIQIYTSDSAKGNNVINYLFNNLQQGYAQAKALALMSCVKTNTCKTIENIKNIDLNTLPLKIY